MAGTAQTLSTATASPLVWFKDFLKEELAPYTGRSETVARITIAATLIMIVCLTFRIPYAFQGAIYAFLVSRESHQATLGSAATLFITTGLGTAYLLVSAWFVLSFPGLHLLWAIGSFFLVFFATSTLSNFGATVAFAIMICIGVPFLDRHVSAETNVEDTLWLCLSVAIGVLITLLVELAFRWHRGDEVLVSITERLTPVENLLTCFAESRAADTATEQKIVHFAMLGTSRLRRILRRSEYSQQYREQMGAVVALVGRIVDLAANATQLGFEFDDEDKKQIRTLTKRIASIRSDLLGGRTPSRIELQSGIEGLHTPPLFREMEQTVALIPEAFTGLTSLLVHAPSPSRDRQSLTIFVADAFSNSDHIKFALKGCLAASLCYILYNLKDWPGISTAVTTCFFTALTTVGSSRQKQALRIAGAIVGGLVMAMGAQVFFLPYIDSIGGFTLVFVACTLVAAWFATASPRLSYFGVQIAVAFYLINLTDFAIQTSLEPARDRVIGILLGLFMMWLVFDQLWKTSAAMAMKKNFIATLRLLAEFAREPVLRELKATIERSYVLRDTINSKFDQVRAQADGVLFEFGPSREQDLAFRDRMRQWQPNLRILFITRIALWKYRIGFPGFELPEAIHLAQQEFDNRLATALDGMADRMNGNGATQKEDLTTAYAHVEQAARQAAPKPELTPQVQSFLLLSRRIVALANSLTSET
jgi:multidrug resistance protein MdtO